MTTLRKKILHSKIQHILQQNNFVLFFQFNNIKFKEWILLKNQILSLQNTSMIVIKNNITSQMLTTHVSTSKLNSNNKCKEKMKVFPGKANLEVKFKLKSNQKNDSTNLFLDNQLPKMKDKMVSTKPFYQLHKNDLNSTYSLTKIIKNNSIFYNPCKNKFSKMKLNDANDIMTDENLRLHLNNDKNQLCFLCQGPTLLVAFNSIQQCKIIYEILNVFTYNLPSTKHMLKFKKSISNTSEHSLAEACFCSPATFGSWLPKGKINSLENKKLPSIFQKNQLTLDSQKHNSLKQNNKKSNLFFIGGLIQGKIINHLDLQKLSTLNNSVYVNLIQQCYSGIIWFLLLKTIFKIKFVKCFENNLINLLYLYKNNMKKEK